RGRVLFADRPVDDGGGCAGGPQGRLPPGRPAPGHDRADPGDHLRPLRSLPRRALRRQTLAEHRLPAPGRDVPLTRADRLVAPEAAFTPSAPESTLPMTSTRGIT